MRHIPSIIRADIMGYCMGVRRAMEVAGEAVREAVREASHDAARTYTYGPLIHNPVALARLAREGVVALEPGKTPLPDDFSGATVIIRAHGIPPAERAELERRYARIVDATCPRVLSSQKWAKQYHDAGYAVILAGDRNHAEIAGIAGYAPGCVVLENREDAERIDSYPDKAVLISQTTIKQSEYDAIASYLSLKIPDLKVFRTICPATQERQNALAELAGKVDGIIVIGGKNSANTQRLFNTAFSITGKAWHIETPEEIPEEAFDLDSIGLTAGASTPDEVIDAVEQALQKG
jgi:4-hydroxy-3-methylbut-2-en-1-yl diphosphate reductase